MDYFGTILRIVRQKKIKGVLAFFMLLLICSCKGNRWQPDVSNIKVEVPVSRFDRDFFSVDTNHLSQGLALLRKKDTLAYDVYFRSLLQLHTRDSIEFLDEVKKMLTDRYWRELYRDEQKIYTDKVIDSLAKEFADAFRHIRYYYPKEQLPKVYTFLKGYNPVEGNLAMFTYRDPADAKSFLLGISLEMYMGSSYKYYSGLEAYGEYQVRRFRRDYIVPEGLRSIFEDKYEEDKLTDETMLSHMIYAGKRLFYLDVMKPELADTLKIEYTTEKLKWCKDNERDMWDHVIRENLLYSTDERKRTKYLGDAPYTAAENVPIESAPRIGEWIGWQIVKHYMDENPKVTLEELFREKDARKILSLAHYRPK